MRIRVLVVDDHPLVREGLALALAGDPDIVVVGEAADGDEALRRIREVSPDVVLLDLHMPGSGGMIVLEHLQSEGLSTRALVITASESAEALLEAIGAGAAGYLTKRSGCEEVRQAVITVHGGGSVITPSLAGHLLREFSQRARGGESLVHPLLSAREQEVLRLIARGWTDREIGDHLYVSERTVQSTLARIRRKTGLHRRSELAHWAGEHAIA
jgi:DNA-binding NarL/FixJ family response regulator